MSAATQAAPTLTVKSVLIKHDRTRAWFEAIHKRGAEKYGAAWLSANMALAEHCQGRVDVSDPAVKELLSFAALRVLMRLDVDGHLVNHSTLKENGEK